MSARRNVSGNLNSDSDDVGGDAAGGVPPKLEPFEAALASLRPRQETLDYDLVMFAAGQASVVAGRRSVAGGRRSASGSQAIVGGTTRRCDVRKWIAWPTAGVMTVVSAVLFFMLLTRPEPEVVERVRIVKVPAGQPEVAGEKAATGPTRELRGVSGRSRVFTVRRLDLPLRESVPVGRYGQLGSRTVCLEMFDRLLREGADPWPKSVGSSAATSELPVEPLPYRQQLKILLDDQARVDSPGRRSSIPPVLGASS